MRKIFIFIAIISFQQIIAQKTISGFTEKSAAEQTALEQKFDGFISAENIGATVKELSAKPHRRDVVYRAGRDNKSTGGGSGRLA